MVRIDNVRPTTLSTDPELTIDFALLGVENNSFLLDFTGEAYCSDGAKIGNLIWQVSMPHRSRRFNLLVNHQGLLLNSLFRQHFVSVVRPSRGSKGFET